MKEYSSEYPMYTCSTPDYTSLEPRPHGLYSPQGMQLPMDEEVDDERYESDSRYMKDMYPDSSKHIQAIVDEELDKLGYENSMMLDEYPSREEIEEMVARIYDRVARELNMPMSTQEAEKEGVNTKETEVENQQYRIPGRNRWLWDNVQVLFLNELFGRRRRRYPRRYRNFSPPYQYYRSRRYLPYQPHVPYNYRYYY